jgi:hypothetical protein
MMQVYLPKFIKKALNYAAHYKKVWFGCHNVSKIYPLFM